MGDVLERELTIANDRGYLKKARDFVQKSIKDSLCPKSFRNRVVLAIDEAVSNIVEHGQNEEKEVTQILIRIKCDQSSLKCVIQDDGVAFNIKNVSDVDMDEHLRQGRKSGLGVFLIRQIMDEIDYSFKEGLRNELVLIKYFEQ